MHSARPTSGRELYGAVQRDDLGLAAHPLEVPPGGVGEFGRDPHDLGVADGPRTSSALPSGAARIMRHLPVPRSLSSTTFGFCSSSTSLPTIPMSAAPYSTKTGTSEGRQTINSVPSAL